MFALFISQSTCAQSWNLDHTTHAVNMKVTFGCDLRRASIGAFNNSAFVDRFTSSKLNPALNDENDVNMVARNSKSAGPKFSDDKSR